MQPSELDQVSSTKKHKKGKLLKNCVDKSKRLDMFGQAFQMNLDDGSNGVRSCTGCLCTFLVVVVTVFYAVSKLDQLLKKQEAYYVSHHTLKDHFNEDHAFTYKNGFNIAVAFIS